jgi:hypothetical protein
VNLDCFIAACVSSWAARVVALPRTIMTAIGGKADMHGRGASTISVAFDPERTKAGLKSRSAAATSRIVCRYGRGRHSARLDSEQFRWSPRTWRPLCGSLSMR